jgi:hypothetical protein
MVSLSPSPLIQRVLDELDSANRSFERREYSFAIMKAKLALNYIDSVSNASLSEDQIRELRERAQFALERSVASFTSLKITIGWMAFSVGDYQAAIQAVDAAKVYGSGDPTSAKEALHFEAHTGVIIGLLDEARKNTIEGKLRAARTYVLGAVTHANIAGIHFSPTVTDNLYGKSPTKSAIYDAISGIQDSLGPDLMKRLEDR